MDSVYIDQDDEEHKASQIPIMDAIYHHAWATIINLSGTSADSGIPRVSGGTVRQPHCEVGEDILVSTLPFLRTYALRSPWGGRAWVLQEAVLSRRCLFFTGSQVYYECHGSQCSEALGDPSHFCAGSEERHRKEGQSLQSQRIFKFDVPRIEGVEHAATKQLALYEDLVIQYNRRKLTHISDSLNAFAAIIGMLSEGMDTEFIWGLPAKYLPSALAWNQNGLGQRTGLFPSWSWVAWEGELRCGAIFSGFDYFQPYFRASKVEGGQTTQICERNTDDINYRDGDIRYRDDDVCYPGDDIDFLKVSNMPFEDVSIEICSGTVETRSSCVLLVEEIIMTLAIDTSDSLENSKSSKPDTPPVVYPGDEKFGLRLSSTYPKGLLFMCGENPLQFLLLGREQGCADVCYVLLLLQWKGGVAFRVDVVRLQVYRKYIPLVLGAVLTEKRF